MWQNPTLLLEWAFQAMRMLGRETIIIWSICNAKSRAFMAFVGRFAWVCEFSKLASSASRWVRFSR